MRLDLFLRGPTPKHVTESVRFHSDGPIVAAGFFIAAVGG